MPTATNLTYISDEDHETNTNSASLGTTDEKVSVQLNDLVQDQYERFCNRMDRMATSVPLSSCYIRGE